jgi:hypothetical protein
MVEPRPSSLVVASDQVIPAQCEGVVIVQLASPLEVENGLVAPSPVVHGSMILYIARIPVLRPPGSTFQGPEC